MTPLDNSTLEAELAQVVETLSQLIRIQSFSREEDATADLMQAFLESRGIATERVGNNVWAKNRHHDANKPTILLHSHHDTVRPNRDWRRDPFTPEIEAGKLYGLGSNDAGGALICLAFTFARWFAEENLSFNILFGAGAEEEIAGADGMSRLIKALPQIDAAIIGEPTEMQAAIGEKGLLVLDCTAHGRSGHAARNVGLNAIEVAMRDIDWLHNYTFPRKSALLGDVKLTVTQIQAGTQHNVIPDRCEFVVDVRVTDVYKLEEVVQLIRENITSDVKARSMRLRSSHIADEHPIVRAARRLNLECFGSPTMSDQALLDMPSIKMGPGKSERSHTADEYVTLDDLALGLRVYHTLLLAMNEEYITKS